MTMSRGLSRFLPMLFVALCAALIAPGLTPRLVTAADPAPMPKDVPTKPKGTLEYNRDVRPILAENCFACHGPDSAARKAGLRIDRRDDAIEAKAIVPGKPAESALIARIFSDDTEERMPPVKSLKKLTPAQKDVL